MRRLPLFVLVATIAIVVAVGGALATSHGTQTRGSEPGTATAGGSDPTVPAPMLAADVPPSQPEGKATATPFKTKSEPAASLSGGRGAKDCRDDCGDPGDSSRGSGAGTLSTAIVDDDGDGGDCGEGD